MKLSRQRQVSLAVLGLGAIALGIDRLGLLPGGSLTGPAASAAASLLVVPSSPSSGLSGVGTPKAERPPAPSERLAALAISENFDLLNVRDAFSVFEPEAMPAEAAAQSPAPSASSMSVAEFERTHKLSAVITPRSGKAVILVGRESVTIGGVLDGFTLEAVTENEAMFRRGNDRATLARSGRTENR